MPFTTSHPAIVIPVKNLFPNHTSLTGLIAGAISPDLIYFLSITTEFRGMSHSWPGLFLYCLPLGIIFSFTFHYLFKKQFISILPAPLDSQFNWLAESDFKIKTAKQWMILVISVLIGALSHFFWDSFTHPHGTVVAVFPFLRSELEIFGVSREVSRWVQHLSSLSGGLIMIYFFNNLRDKSHSQPADIIRVKYRKLKFWLWAIPLMVILALAGTYYHDIRNDWEFFENGYSKSLGFISLGLGCWAGFYWAVIFAGLFNREANR